MKPKYQELRECASKMNEKNDCAVKAISIVARVSYFKAHEALTAHGRLPRKGTTFKTQTVPALASLGIEITQVKRDRQPSGSRYTPKTIGQKLKKGYYLCRCKGHIFAVVNGVVEDWTDGRQHRINQIWKVNKKRK